MGVKSSSTGRFAGEADPYSGRLAGLKQRLCAALKELLHLQAEAGADREEERTPARSRRSQRRAL